MIYYTLKAKDGKEDPYYHTRTYNRWHSYPRLWHRRSDPQSALNYYKRSYEFKFTKREVAIVRVYVAVGEGD